MDWVILGCGYVGARLARALLADGERVRVCARRVDRLQPLAEAGAQVHAVDASKLRAFGPALYGTRSPIVVYSIPPVANMPAGEPIRRATEAATGAGAQRFIYLSSTAVYGPAEDGVTVDEESPIAIGDADAASRISDESAVETARLAGLHTVILRLAAIYGPGRGVRERLKAGTYKLIDDGVHDFSRVHVDDLVAIIRAAAARAPSGALYCVADDRPTTQKEYADWLAARMGKPPAPSVPSLAPGAPRRPVRNRRVSNARLRRELDYTFRYPSYLEGELAIEREVGLAAEPSAPAAPEPSAPAAPEPAPAAPEAIQREARSSELARQELAEAARHLDEARAAFGRALAHRNLDLARLRADETADPSLRALAERLEEAHAALARLGTFAKMSGS